jgi:protein-S-isoprenylcysteine O-methyltransferase Ste14
MDWVRIYLLAGLIIHKALWESLKRLPAQRRVAGKKSQTVNQPINLRLVKGIKVVILAGLIAQTMLPTILPITSSPQALQAAGITIFTLGLITAMLGRIQLGSNWSDIETAQVLSRQTVISHGLYRYIRHPIYVGDLLLLLGFELSLNSWLVFAVAFMSPFVLWKAVREERMLGAALPGYNSYCARTKRFIPFVV